MIKKEDPNIEQQIWYIYVDQQPRGPLAIRDLDVLIRTNQITSKTPGWKTGMKQWKPLNQIQQIKDSILESFIEIIQIDKKRTSLFDQKTSKFGPKIEEKPPEQEPAQDGQMMVNKDQNNDTLAILASTVQNLVKNSFVQNSDGKWNIFDEVKNQWFTQSQEPKQQIENLKKNLLSKLTAQLFSTKKQTKRKREPVSKQVVQNLTKQELQKREKNRKKAKKVAQKKKQKWYNPKVNTFIYISGLPFDLTFQQLKEFAQRAGILRIDHQSGKEKIKIYKDQQGNPKGDAAISYAKQQSVQIALDMLNQREIKPGYRVKIERAAFEQKNQQYKPRQQKKVTKANKILAKKTEQKMFTWDQNDEGDGLKILILKNMFTLDQIENQRFLQETKQDIKAQCEKIGPITRIRFYETHPEGIVQVKFKQEKDASICKQMMNGRYFDGRQIECDYWDGETNYKTTQVVKEVEAERIDNFGAWLQQQIQKTVQETIVNTEPNTKVLTMEELENLEPQKTS